MLRSAHIVAALVLLQTLVAWGQQLVVNGRQVAGLTLVQGNSYAPADAFGAALGADTFYDAGGQTVTFELAGRLLSVRLGNGAGAVSLDGEEVAAEGAVLSDGVFLVPVKPIATALGGTVTWLQSQQTVMAVLPRARLRGVELDGGTSRGYERLVLDFDGLTPFETYFNSALGALQLRFERADVESLQTLSGDFFSSAVTTKNAGYLDFRVNLRPGYRYESYTSPRRGGFTVVVDLLPETAPIDEVASAAIRPVLVLDPGHGGSDEGLRFADSEKVLTLRFALWLAEALQARDIDVRLTRRDDAALPLELRSQAGIGASLFVSLHAADLPAGQFNLYYLGDQGSGPGFDSALRENAEAALDAPSTDRLRRRVLLNLVPDLALGGRYARDLSAELGGSTSLRSALVTSAPLAVLNGAAGRGLLLELSPDDLTDEQLAAALAAALAGVLAQGNVD